MASIIYKGTNGVGGGSGNTIYAFSDGAYTWQAITADTTAQDNYAYLVDDPDPVVISPPNSPNVGDTFLAMSINGVVAFDFKINGEYNADILKAIQIGSINTPFRFFYTGATYGWACENANEFGIYSASDPYFNNVVLFIKGDGTNGSTSIIDESPTPKTISVFGNAQISTTQSKYGGSSIYYPSNPSYTTNLDSMTGFNLSSEDWTIESWCYFTDMSTEYSHICNIGTSDANRIAFYLSNRTKPAFFSAVGGSVSNRITSSSTVGVNIWIHLALSKTGTTTYLFVDGVEKGSIVSAPYPTTTNNTISVGNNNFGTILNNHIGYFDSFRVTKGVARYIANFDPELDTYLAY